MHMTRNLLLTGAAAMLLLGGTAQADTPVTSDAGNFASFQLANNGDGTFTLTLTPPATLTSINGVNVSIAATFDSTITFGATVSGIDVTVTSGGGPYTKTFGEGDEIASLSYNIQAGQIGTGFNSNGFLLSGTILSVSPNALPPDYDFSGLIGGTNTFALTGSDYTGGASSIADVFAIAGASVTGSGGFSENRAIATPEPSSMALLGIGLSGLFAVRRIFKRSLAV